MKIITEEQGERLDKFLAKKTDYTRNLIAKMLDKDLITVNDKNEKASYKIRLNDVIVLPDNYSEEEIFKLSSDGNYLKETTRNYYNNN